MVHGTREEQREMQETASEDQCNSFGAYTPMLGISGRVSGG